MRRAPFAQPLTISPTDHVRGKCSKNNPISDCPWLDFGVYYFVKSPDGKKNKVLMTLYIVDETHVCCNR